MAKIFVNPQNLTQAQIDKTLHTTTQALQQALMVLKDELSEKKERKEARNSISANIGKIKQIIRCVEICPSANISSEQANDALTKWLKIQSKYKIDKKAGRSKTQQKILLLNKNLKRVD